MTTDRRQLYDADDTNHGLSYTDWCTAWDAWDPDGALDWPDWVDAWKIAEGRTPDTPP